MDLEVSEKSLAILRHILMRSFDATYRMGGKSFRVFSLQYDVPSRSSVVGSQAVHIQSYTSSLYISNPTNPAFDARLFYNVNFLRN